MCDRCSCVGSAGLIKRAARACLSHARLLVPRQLLLPCSPSCVHPWVNSVASFSRKRQRDADQRLCSERRRGRIWNSITGLSLSLLLSAAFWHAQLTFFQFALVAHRLFLSLLLFSLLSSPRLSVKWPRVVRSPGCPNARSCAIVCNRAHLAQWRLSEHQPLFACDATPLACSQAASKTGLRKGSTIIRCWMYARRNE